MCIDVIIGVSLCWEMGEMGEEEGEKEGIDEMNGGNERLQGRGRLEHTIVDGLWWSSKDK